MTSKVQHAELISIIRRRPVGKGAWRMAVTLVMDAVQELLDVLEEIGKLHQKDAETQRLVSKGAFAGAEAMKELSLLLLYKEEATTNGSDDGNRRGGDLGRERDE